MEQAIHRTAAVVSIGDELTLGQKLDTNSQWISRSLVDRGVVVREHITLADDLAQNIAAFERLAAEHPLIICTGGLGPTADDLTRQALAAVMKENLVEDGRALAQIRTIMERRGRAMSDNQRVQALRPASAVMIDNPNGTAPGIHGHIASRGCDIFCLPGPPGEMRPMFDSFIVPRLHTDPSRAVMTSVLHCLGIGEGDLAKRLGPLMDRARNPLVGTTASGGVVSIRIRYEGDATLGPTALAATERECRDLAGPFLFGDGEQTIEGVVLEMLRERRERLVVAESCTGGGLGGLLTGVSGSSDAFMGGWITYANEMKTIEVGVPSDLIEKHGAVSQPVAMAMARGALRHAGPAHHALAITGIAGPSGGSESKPVGTVFIARASRTPIRREELAQAAGESPYSVETRRFLVTGDRNDIRGRSARIALMMLRFHLLGLPVPRMLWQVSIDGSGSPA
jgi:nicotinamide-nucleotide amidase